MIKIGNEIKDIKIGSKQVVKVCRGINIIWEKIVDKLVYSDSESSNYYIRVGTSGEINPNKNYRFVTNEADQKYAIVIGSSYTAIKNNDIFTISKNCDIKIRNLDYSYYNIKLYETKEKATIKI